MHLVIIIINSKHVQSTLQSPRFNYIICTVRYYGERSARDAIGCVLMVFAASDWPDTRRRGEIIAVIYYYDYREGCATLSPRRRYSATMSHQ